MDHTTRLSALPSVGKVLATRLRRLGLETVGDLIFYYPTRYDDFGAPTTVSRLEPGQLATIVGTIDMIATRRSRARRRLMTEAVISDETGSIKAMWFNQPWIGQQLRSGQRLRFSGKVAGDMFAPYLASPTHEPLTASGQSALVPVYPTTEGLTQKRLQALVAIALPSVEHIPEIIPAPLRSRYHVVSRAEALREIHQPTSQAQLAQARRRLALEELFIIQLHGQLLRQRRTQQSAVPIPFDQGAIQRFVADLPFELTIDQKRAAWEIIQDLEKSQPMNRLLQGDVGSGKTAVALLAAYATTHAHQQAALMAPTEILALQHFATARRLLASTPVRIGLLTRTQALLGATTVKKSVLLEHVAAGEVDVLIGTHALIQKGVQWHALALVVVDEQHRFGVRQRQLLREAVGEQQPHLLSLTATPIPRSLALTLYGDLDVSIIASAPRGRRPILTRVVTPDKRESTYTFIRQQVSEGRQAFVVCPLIDPSDTLGIRAATDEFDRLAKSVFPDLRVTLLHGRLKSAEKESALADFVQRRSDILVATTVVEVGIDIPNATIMMIEGAERFGLAQLHQLRGRVGRDAHQSYCFLMTDALDAEALDRLQLVAACHDGFELAQHDLNLRGAGQLYGYQQSGYESLKIADLSDLALVKASRELAQDFMSTDRLADNPTLQALVEAVGQTEHLE